MTKAPNADRSKSGPNADQKNNLIDLLQKSRAAKLTVGIPPGAIELTSRPTVPEVTTYSYNW